MIIENHARKIKASRGKHHRYKVPFLKTKKMIHCESSIERDYVKILDFEPNIVDIIYQPLQIPYIYREKIRNYYPDFKVLTKKGDVWIVEIKPEEKLRNEDNLIKYVVGRLYCNQFGWEYRIVTDKLIRPGYFQENLAILRALGSQLVEIKYLSIVFQKLKQYDTCSINMLRGYCNELEDEVFYKAIYALIYHKNIYVDLISKRLDGEAVVSVGERM
ncbi:TnsA endonuclease N-terminal domain-containing protein [Paenibacillus sp. PastF-3]|uniref:TnsA endonuclease N-terminal domain-containing protein n=1 Tax=Paenibacillus sp. PastF-3 TaxID=2940626 RepID=UPI002475FA28|nr:TnsA endonuclease N-terminal domain-containing protein [Paenibacillus sp. PastF-3]